MYVDRRTHTLAIANLIAQIGIIVTGGLVRLTGSGLGCSQWPLCEPGQFTPQFTEESSIHPYIEFGNRTLTGVLGIIALGLIWSVYHREPTASRPEIKKLAWFPLIGIIIQALVGGMTVWVDLHPAIVGSHMLISLALVAVSAYLLWRMVGPDTPPRPLASFARPLTIALALSAALLVALGVVVTGAGPHSGDAEAPYRWAMDTVMITRVHSAAAWLFTGLTITAIMLVNRLQGETGEEQAAMSAFLAVLAVTVLEGLVGYIQHATNLPEALVIIHMLLAALLVTTVTRAAASLHPRSPAIVHSSPTAAHRR